MLTRLFIGRCTIGAGLIMQEC